MTEVDIVQKAKEYTNKNDTIVMGFEEDLDCTDKMQQAFIDGYHECQKEHEWHDLRKDPTDLPKKKELILIKIVGCYILGWYDNKVWYKDGINENEIPQEYVIKWKEIE